MKTARLIAAALVLAPLAAQAGIEVLGAPLPDTVTKVGEYRYRSYESWKETLKSLDKIYDTSELAAGNDIIFCATGVTDGDLLRGVRFFGGGIRTSSLFMSLKTNSIRFVDTIHREEGSKLAVSLG